MRVSCIVECVNNTSDGVLGTVLHLGCLKQAGQYHPHAGQVLVPDRQKAQCHCSLPLALRQRQKGGRDRRVAETEGWQRQKGGRDRRVAETEGWQRQKGSKLCTIDVYAGTE